MPGPRFDWGAFLEKGGQFAYDYLSEQQKHKRKMQGLVDEEKRKQEERERDREDTRKEFGMGIIEKVVSGEFNPHTKQKFAQWGIEQGWIDPGILGLGVTPPPAMPKAEFGTPGYWQQGAQMGALPPLRPEDVAGAGALFEAPAVAEDETGEMFGKVEEEKTYKEKVTNWVEKHPNKPYPGITMEQTHQVLGARIAPTRPTGAMTAIGRENIRKYFVRAAADIRTGSLPGQGMFKDTRTTLPEDMKEAMALVQSMYGVSPTSPTGFWEELIEPAMRERWPDVEALTKNQKVRRQVRIHLKDDYKVRNVTEKQIDDYIRKNPNIAKELQ